MDINRLITCALLFFMPYGGICRIIESGLAQPIGEGCIVISNGGHWVSSDPCWCDALDVLVFVTGGDRSYNGIKKEGRYRFKKMLGPFGAATFTGWGSMEKPSMATDVRSVHATASVGGVDEESAIRMLVRVKDSLNRMIRHDGFIERRKGERGTEIVSSGPVMGGWNITLSCEATGDEMWRFDLKMEHAGLATSKELRLIRAPTEDNVVSGI